MYKDSIMNKIYLLVLLIFSTQLISCATSYPVIQSDKSLLSNNPMNKIALIGSSTVVYELGDKEPYTDLLSSTTAIETLMPRIKEQLKTKGYTITFSEPVAAALPLKSFRGKTMSKYPMYADIKNKGKDSKSSNLKDSEPGKVYDLSIKHIKKPALNMAFDLADAVSDSGGMDMISYVPNINYINAILSATKSDTVCQFRVLGYQDGRYYFPDLLKAIIGTIFPKHETSLLSFVCSNASGKSLWQKAFYLENDDPTNIKPEQLKEYLNSFPEAGKPLSKNCSKHDGNTHLFVCD